MKLGRLTYLALALGIASILTFGTASLAASAVAYQALRRPGTRLNRWVNYVVFGLAALGIGLFAMTLWFLVEDQEPNLWDYLDPANYVVEPVPLYGLVWGGIIVVLGLGAWLLTRPRSNVAQTSVPSSG